jgi:hypothetical protein
MIKDHIEEIKTILERFEQEAHAKQIKGDANWTYEIKRKLMEAGESHEYKTCASGFKDECDPEWLYDVVWYKEEGTGDDSRLIDVPMILESEWQSHLKSIKYDFEKLLQANARLKVMICQAYEKHKESRLEYFRDAIAKFQRNIHEDVYLIAILNTTDEKFYFEVIRK